MQSSICSLGGDRRVEAGESATGGRFAVSWFGGAACRLPESFDAAEPPARCYWSSPASVLLLPGRSPDAEEVVHAGDWALIHHGLEI